MVAASVYNENAFAGSAQEVTSERSYPAFRSQEAAAGTTP
jgi:hypothetical protein